MNDWDIQTQDGGRIAISEFSADEAFFSISYAGCRASTTLTIAEARALSAALLVAADEMQQAMEVAV